MTALGASQTELLKGQRYGLLETSGSGSVVSIKPRDVSMPFDFTMPAGAGVELDGDVIEWIRLSSGAVDFARGVRYSIQGPSAAAGSGDFQTPTDLVLELRLDGTNHDYYFS